MTYGDQENLTLEIRTAIEEGMRVQAIRRPLEPGEAYALASKIIAHLKRQGWSFSRASSPNLSGGYFGGAYD